jgi:23S rRNA (guanine2445-N2)-methyltransferase
MLEIFKNEFKMTAKTFEGLEPVLADELKELGATNVVIQRRAVEFSGDKKLLYKANYALRTALSILVPIHEFSAVDDTSFYKGISEINWHKIIGEKDTVAVNSTVFSDHFKHSKFITLRTKDAIVDQLKRRRGFRPDVDTLNPKIKVNVYISNDKVLVSLDSSGEPLFKRGYRKNGYIAPINEALAAGMIMLSGWKGQSDLIDPMCGSGTILIEAALIAHKIPPGLYRSNFGFENWMNFDADLMEDVAEELDAESDFKFNIYGSDSSETAMELTIENIKSASLENKINLRRMKFENLEPESKSGIMITNPPYGERIKKADLEQFYAMIGNRLKQKFKGYEAWIISSNMDAFKSIGLQTSRKIKLFNGQLECRFNNYSIYDGSKKAKYQKKGSFNNKNKQD